MTMTPSNVDRWAVALRPGWCCVCGATQQTRAIIRYATTGSPVWARACSAHEQQVSDLLDALMDRQACPTPELAERARWLAGEASRDAARFRDEHPRIDRAARQHAAYWARIAGRLGRLATGGESA